MKMFRFTALAAALFLAVFQPAVVEAQWQTPNHSVPVGRGAGVTGFGGAAPGAAGGPLVSNGATSDPSFSPSASSWFDSAFCNTVGYVVARTTGGWVCNGNIPVEARWLGATGNNSTDDTTALQSAITAAESTTSRKLHIAAGQYKTSASLNITTHIDIGGDGVQSSGRQCYTIAGCSNLPAASMADATTILPSSTTSAFNIASDDAVQIHDLQVGYPTQPTALSGITCFVIGPSVTTHNVSQTSVWNTMCSGADRGLYSLNCVHCSFHHNHFYNEISYSIYADGTPANTNGNVGDSEIASNTFVSGSATAMTHININAGGGWRIVNNKLDTGGSINRTTGILIDPQATNASIEPMVIAGNSMEGCNICIHYTSPGSGVTATQGVITGNQLWGANNATLSTKGVAIQIDSGSQWVSGLTVAGNYLNVDGGASCGTSCPIVVIGNSAASNVNFSGNTFGVVTGTGVAFSFGTGLSNIKTSGNLGGAGVTVGSNTTGTLTCGTALTNGNANAIEGLLSGGAGATQIAINGNSNFNQSSAALPPMSFILNPGDTITPTCSTAPNNTWRAINP